MDSAYGMDSSLRSNNSIVLYQNAQTERDPVLATTLKNCACLVAATVSGILLSYEAFQDEPDERLTTTGAIVLGATIEAFSQINFNKETLQLANNFASRWALAGLDSTWLVFNNVDIFTLKEACLGVIRGQFGFLVTNEFFNILQQTKESRVYHVLNEKDLQSDQDANPILGCNLGIKSKAMIVAGVTTAGVATTLFGYFTSYSPVAITSVGWFFSLLTLGMCAAEFALTYRKNMLEDEQQPLALQDINSTEDEPRVSKKEWVWRQLSNTVQLVGPQCMVGLLWAAQTFYPPLIPFSFGVTGFCTGLILRVKHISFTRGLTRAVYVAQQNANTYLNNLGRTCRNRALIVDTIFAGLLSLGIIGGSAAAIFYSDWEGAVGIGSFVGGFAGSSLLTGIAELFFEPGQSSRAMNFLRYVLFDNSYLITIGYYFCTNVTEITDKALDIDDRQKLIYGFVGLFLYGMMFGNVTIRNISKNRPNPDYTQAPYKAGAFNRVVQSFAGLLDPNTGSV